MNSGMKLLTGLNRIKNNKKGFGHCQTLLKFRKILKNRGRSGIIGLINLKKGEYIGKI